MVSVHAAKDAIETAKDDGRAEGRAEGIEETNRANARKMQAKGYLVADIAEITGLSMEDVDSL